MPSKIKILSLNHFTSAKDGKTWFVASAEIPALVPGGWSTVRLRAVQESPFPSFLKVGSEIPLVLVRFDAIRGEGVFNIPA